MTHAEMAAQFSEAFDKPVVFVNVPPAVMREALLSFHVPEWQADGLLEDYAHYSRGEAANVSSAVEEVTGVPPRSFAAFARDYKQAFLQ